MNSAKRVRNTRCKRPLAALNRVFLQDLLKCPSKSIHLRSPCGRTTQTRFLKDIFVVMDVLVSQMCSRTRKIGVSSANGYFLFTWARVADLAQLPEYRVKQCVAYLKQRGWITSQQPWTVRVNKDGKAKLVALTSIKKVTTKYFHDMGLIRAYQAAKEAGAQTIVQRAAQLKRSVRYILTPISLLAERRKAAS